MAKNSVAQTSHRPTDDGGPAFPTEERIENFRDVAATNGMSLRDYFAAHAPKRVWNHFHPDMPPRPEPEWGDTKPDDRWDASPFNWREIDAWKTERARQVELQWPYFYADAMLAERRR